MPSIATTRIDIGRALARLTPVQRQLCQMLGEEGLTIKEAAERLRIPAAPCTREIKRIRPGVRRSGAWRLSEGVARHFSTRFRMPEDRPESARNR